MHDLLDVVRALIALTDPGDYYAVRHAAKTGALGGFTTMTQWNPVPQ
jgi:hypothetical protein